MNARWLKVLLTLSLIANITAIGGLWALYSRRPVARTVSGGTCSWSYQETAEGYSQLPTGPGGIVFLGDSLTVEGPWGELFANVMSRGIRGDTVAGVLRRLPEVVDRKPAKVFLLVGINDLLHGGGEAVVVRGIEAIATKMKETSPDTRLFIISLLPVAAEGPASSRVNNRAISRVNLALRTVAQAHSATFVDLHSRLTDANGELQRELTYDGLHLRPKGYLVWRDALTSFMVPALETGSPTAGVCR